MKSSFDTSEEFALTAEQQAVVAHDFGPALVFAVAGAGKTTSMVHRIKRLVNEGVVPAHRILATSFNRANVDELKHDLSLMNVRGTVNCRTLHSLGYSLMRTAVKKGYLDGSWLLGREIESYGNMLLTRTIIALSKEEDTDSSLLDIDREELENQISVWKNNLVYANLKKSGLPPEAKKIAAQATHENGLYVRAYQIYEEERQREHWITFDDMLLTGWELLVSFPDLCAEIQNSFDMVLVDEFQDLNLAQYEMLALIVEKHKNYMAIGDDDQCIYEWRGASPGFILGFEEEYSAEVYAITDNFRCTAQQTMLANSIISCNKSRYEKLLNLTRGFGGNTLVKSEPSEEVMARTLVEQIKALLDSGEDVDDIAILIRLYSQTTLLEAELIQNNMPYDVVGHAPFYERHELTVLFKYLAWAMQEAEIQKSGLPYDQRQRDKYLDRFRSIINTPRRYVSNVMISEICNQAMGTGRSILDVLADKTDSMKRGTKHKMIGFVKFARTLIKRVSSNDSASAVLNWLIQEIDYEKHLVEKSGMHETGMTKVQTVEVLKKLAKGKGNSREFLNHIVYLSQSRKQIQGKKLRLMTMYRAKGLEWKHVFIPNVNSGVIPFGVNEKNLSKEELAVQTEAERRLFYVGITRSKKNLYLYNSKEQPNCSFLTEVSAERVLDSCGDIAGWLDGSKPLDATAVVDLAMRVKVFSLKRYFKHWAVFPDGFYARFNAAVNGLDTLFHQIDMDSVEALLAASPTAKKVLSPYFVAGMKTLCRALGEEFDEDTVVDLKSRAGKISKAVEVYDEYLTTERLRRKLRLKDKALVRGLLFLQWVEKDADDELVLTDKGRAAGAIVIDDDIRWSPGLVDSDELVDAVEQSKPVSLKGYLSTTKLAWKLGVEDYQLFEYLVSIGWLMKHGIRHVLTKEGEEKGGRMRKGKGNKKTIVWPPELVNDEAFFEF